MPDGSRRQRETTIEVSSRIRSWERVTQKVRENVTKHVSFRAREHSTLATSPMKKWPSLKDSLVSRRIMYTSVSLRESSPKMPLGAKERSHDG